MPAKSKGKSPARRRHAALPLDACPTCGTLMREKKGRLGLPVNGEEIVVPNTPHLLCPKCHEVVLRWDDAGFLEGHARAIYRKRYRLLSPEDIRVIRERSGMTQVELGRLLRLGPNTLSRWESDRNVQTGAMDVLLRLVRDVPGSLAYLRRHAA